MRVEFGVRWAIIVSADKCSDTQGSGTIPPLPFFYQNEINQTSYIYFSKGFLCNMREATF